MAPWLPEQAWANPHDNKYDPPVLNRPVVSIANAHTWEIWTQFDRFTPALDLFNFAAKSGTSSRITRISAYTLGAAYNPTNRINLRYNFQVSDQSGSRKTEPFQINTRFYRHEARLQYAFYSDYPWRFSVETGMRAHYGRKESFQRLSIGPVFGGSGVIKLPEFTLAFDNNGVVSSSNPAFPVFSEQAKDFAFLAAIRGRYEPLRSLDIDLGIEVRRVRISTQFASPALTHANAIVGTSLLASAQKKATQNFPQTTPWHETHLLLQGSMTWHPWKGVTLAGDWTHYQIKRQGFDPKGSTKNFTNADQFDGYAMIQVPNGITVYLHGRASTHFVLGDQPLTFNSRTSSKFKNPFGIVSMGATMNF